MSIQHDEANKLKKHWNGDKCYHMWEKEYYLATQTGDYRCAICGDCMRAEEFQEERKNGGQLKNERN